LSYGMEMVNNRMLKTIIVGSGLCLGSVAVAEISIERLSEGFKRPVDLQAAPGNADQLFVVEQRGVIIAIDRRTGKRGDVLLDIHEQVSREGNEEGLLGLSFSPDFAESGRFYVNFTDKTPKKAITRISRFTVAAGKKTASASSEEILLSYEQDFRNHNGGWIGFGPDGYLYVANGDGGSANDPKARAQQMDSYLGKILRIDVSGKAGYSVPKDNPFVGKDGVKPEIYSYGLRNPWRCSFDAKTGDFWVADVGQYHYEEVNVLGPDEAKGRNFGWREREGTHANPKKEIAGPSPSGAVQPVYQYGHGKKNNEGLSLTGGFVYRGANPDLKGKYVFADYVTCRLWTLDKHNSYAFDDITDRVLKKGQKLGPIASFAQDNENDLYVIDHSGVIWRIR